ncbi:MAG: hypothetical protein ACFFAS_05165 [Promethearchaeota archaeon]
MNDKEEQPIDDHLIQKIVDLFTGKDITEGYIRERLKELSIIADQIIDFAIKEHNSKLAESFKIYQDAYWQIHQKLGMGSIGPATAAAGPLMNEKKKELARKLHIPEDQELY